MPEQPSPPQSQPPPLPAGGAVPPLPISYAGRGPGPARPDGPAGQAQKVFDTVAGPNTRLIDNLVQLACVIAGGGFGSLIGSRYGSPWTTLGIIVGVFAALLLSGAVIGVVRFVRATRK
jgi:hypothetical protein